MKLPQYTKKDLLIMAINLPPVVILFNSLLFGKRFFTEPEVFILSGLIVLSIMTMTWILFTWIAVTTRNRLPAFKDLVKRLIITILIIAIIQAFVITLIFRGYNYFHLLGYNLNESRYYWTLSVGLFINIIITMIHEGAENFEKWKATFTEAEQLKTSYTQSQLMGLKSQVNPHFLFNSLNSLSGLIQEDEEKAEKFLNELTKIYRYFLRGNEEQLVTLETELQFIKSYYYLLEARYGSSILLEINVDEKNLNKYVAPYLLQTIFEYGFNTNTLSKALPLNFRIYIDENEWLKIEYNLQQKQGSLSKKTEGIYNLIEKYKLLSSEEIEINDDSKTFAIKIPLLNDAFLNKHEIIKA